MGAIKIGGAGGFQRSENTRQEFDREINYEHVEEIVANLSRAASLRSDKACYVYGMGGLPKSTYVELGQESGIQVIFFRSTLPLCARFLKYVVGSYEGLVRVEDLTKLPDVFLKLINQSMAGIYCLSPSFEKQFLRLVAERERYRYYDFGIKDDPGYLFYIVDADNHEVSTGIVEVVSYGIAAPVDMVSAIR